jgi:hypothetical protein
MVLPTFDPVVDVDPSPAVPSTMDHPPNYEGGTVVQDQSPGDLDIAVQVQGPIPQLNPVQEINLFIGEYCRTFRLAPMAGVKSIMDILQAFDQQTYHCGGAKGLGADFTPRIG